MTIPRARSKSLFRSAPAARPTCYTRAIARGTAQVAAPAFRHGEPPRRRAPPSAPMSSRRRAPDGYTLLMVSGTQTVNETLNAHKPYQLMRDFVPIAPLIDTDLVLVVHPSVPAKTVERVARARTRQAGHAQLRLVRARLELPHGRRALKNLTGIDIVHVPYKGSTGARNDILSGQIQMLFDWVPTMAPHDQGRQWCARSAPAARRARRYCRMCRPSPRPAYPVSGDALGRLHGAGGHAAADRRQAQCEITKILRAARHQGRPGKRQGATPMR